MGALQKPDASNVAGIRTWNSMGRFVKRGEKGIFILAPMIGKKRSQEEEASAEDDEKNTASPGFTASVASTGSTDCLVICGRAFARSM